MLLVLTEVKLLSSSLTKRVFYKAATAFAAEIVSSLVVDFVTDLLAFGSVQVFEDVVDFKQMVSIFRKVVIDRIE